MKIFAVIVLVPFLLGIGGSAFIVSARAEDTVVIYRAIVTPSADGSNVIQKEEQAFFGSVAVVSKTEVQLVTPEQTRSFPTGKIVSILYENEPIELTVARLLIRTSQFEEAETKLTEIQDRQFLPAQIQEEIDFLTLQSQAENALINPSNFSSDEKRQRANRLVLFIQQKPESRHFYFACLLAGQLLREANDLNRALDLFQMVTKAPWLETKLNALLQKSKILLLLHRPAEAEKDLWNERNTLNVARKIPELQPLLIQIELTRLDSLADQNRFQESIAGYRKLIKEAEKINEKTYARIYNCLAKTLERSGNDEEAVHAFLYVDLLYSGAREEHIVALKRLAVLWQKLGKPERAQEAEKILKDRYGL